MLSRDAGHGAREQKPHGCRWAGEVRVREIDADTTRRSADR